MPITVGYDPVEAMGQGANAAGYGQLLQNIQARHEAQQMQMMQMQQERDMQNQQLQAQQDRQMQAHDFEQNDEQQQYDHEQQQYDQSEQRRLSMASNAHDAIDQDPNLTNEEKHAAHVQATLKYGAGLDDVSNFRKMSQKPYDLQEAYGKAITGPDGSKAFMGPDGTMQTLDAADNESTPAEFDPNKHIQQGPDGSTILLDPAGKHPPTIHYPPKTKEPAEAKPPSLHDYIKTLYNLRESMATEGEIGPDGKAKKIYPSDDELQAAYIKHMAAYKQLHGTPVDTEGPVGRAAIPQTPATPKAALDPQTTQTVRALAAQARAQGMGKEATKAFIAQHLQNGQGQQEQ